MLVLLGIRQAFMGIAAIAEGEFFVRVPNCIYELDVGGWGWVHLVIGIIMAIVGFFPHHRRRVGPGSWNNAGGPVGHQQLLLPALLSALVDRGDRDRHVRGLGPGRRR
jgi:hypothetical protein